MRQTCIWSRCSAAPGSWANTRVAQQSRCSWAVCGAAQLHKIDRQHERGLVRKQLVARPTETVKILRDRFSHRLGFSQRALFLPLRLELEAAPVLLHLAHEIFSACVRKRGLHGAMQQRADIGSIVGCAAPQPRDDPVERAALSALHLRRADRNRGVWVVLDVDKGRPGARSRHPVPFVGVRACHAVTRERDQRVAGLCIARVVRAPSPRTALWMASVVAQASMLAMTCLIRV